ICYNERLEINMNFEEEFEDTTHKNEVDTLLDEAEEFQSISIIDEGLAKAIS
ncbi:4915_t:CDS:1, partial [Funneliformis geosporum]